MNPEPASAGGTSDPVPPLRGSSSQTNAHPAFRFAPRWAILTPRLRRSAVECRAVKAHGRFSDATENLCRPYGAHHPKLMRTQRSASLHAGLS